MILNEKIAFDAPTSTDDGYGGVETGWAEQFQARAQFLYLRGGETVQAARLEGRQPVVVTIRSNADALAVTPDYRLRDLRRGTVYNIRSVIEAEDRRHIEITAESGVA